MSRDLLAAATPTPWGLDPAHEGFIGGDPIGSENEWQEIVAGTRSLSVEDAALIVAAANEYEALLDVEAASIKLREADEAFLAAVFTADAEVSREAWAEAMQALTDALARLDAVRSGS